MKFFLLLRIEKKNYVNLSQNCAATKRCCFVWRHTTQYRQNRQNVAPYWNGERGEKKIQSYM